jgi:hypothetical protein
MELGKAWCGSWCPGRPARRALVTGELWQRRQSTREGERGRNEVGERERAGVGGAQKGDRAHGQATWTDFSACVRARGSAAVAGKMELTGLAHGAEA